MSNNQFERMFGFRPKPAMTKAQKERAQAIDQLFGAMRDELGMSTRDVFRAYADALHSKFIAVTGSVLECPPEVERFCQEALKPDSRARLRHALILHMAQKK